MLQRAVKEKVPIQTTFPPNHIMLAHPHVLFGNSRWWRHNEHDGVSNHQHHDCLLNRLFRRRSKKISNLRVIGLCAGNSPVTGEFSAQMASNAENVSIWWRHHIHLFSDAVCQAPVKCMQISLQQNRRTFINRACITVMHYLLFFLDCNELQILVLAFRTID